MYTYSGMDFDHRGQNLKGSNKDIWEILYAELDYTLKTATGHLEVMRRKSHSDGTQLYSRGTPLWQMGVNNLADKAADIFSDFEGNEHTLTSFKATAAKLQTVCHRLAAIESELRRGTPERLHVEADIVNKCQAYGTLRREAWRIGLNSPKIQTGIVCTCIKQRKRNCAATAPKRYTPCSHCQTTARRVYKEAHGGVPDAPCTHEANCKSSTT